MFRNPFGFTARQPRQDIPYIVGRENRSEVRVCVPRSRYVSGAAIRVEFCVEQDGLNGLLRRLKGSHEAMRAVAENAVPAQSGKMGDPPMAGTKGIPAC